MAAVRRIELQKSFVVVPVFYKISPKSDYIPLKYGDMTIFKMALVKIKNFQSLTFVPFCGI